MRRALLAATLAASAVAAAGAAYAKRMMRPIDFTPPSFAIVSGHALGGDQPATGSAAFLASSRIAAVGDGALAIDADSGVLVRTDAAGNSIAQLAIGRNAGVLAYDPLARRAYVADRGGNRVAVVEVGAQLKLVASWPTPVEPYGVALAPDRKTLLVTTIADRTLIALDTATGAAQWHAPLGREPRGIAISPDGTRALVASIASGAVDQIALGGQHREDHIAITTQSPAAQTKCGADCTGEQFARDAEAVAFIGAHEAVVPFQRETPVQQIGAGERAGSYGGGFEPPIVHQLAFLGLDGERTAQTIATISEHQPHAIAWDAAHDALYVAGLGNDTVLQVRNASQRTLVEGVSTTAMSGKERCGPEGLAIGTGGTVWVWCAFTRSVERLDFVDATGALATASKMTAGPTLVASALDDKAHGGYVLFHAADAAVSRGGALACASCHPDGRDDGLTWRIEKASLQTPLLAGRVAGTHPYKWDGGDPDLPTSLTTTMRRLGGFGLQPAQTEALAAYLNGLPAPRTPARDATQVARGKQLFDSAALGCRSCHDGAKYTDQDKHKFTTSTLPEADTPSLIGLAASAPYYHDGSAITLEALLRDRGAVHGMADTSKLTDGQVDDLTAFLETL